MPSSPPSAHYPYGIIRTPPLSLTLKCEHQAKALTHANTEREIFPRGKRPLQEACRAKDSRCRIEIRPVMREIDARGQERTRWESIPLERTRGAVRRRRLRSRRIVRCLSCLSPPGVSSWTAQRRPARHAGVPALVYGGALFCHRRASHSPRRGQDRHRLHASNGPAARHRRRPTR
jgi:hypothetical protein